MGITDPLIPIPPKGITSTPRGESDTQVTLGEHAVHWTKTNREHALQLLLDGDTEGAWWHTKEAQRIEDMIHET